MSHRDGAGDDAVDVQCLEGGAHPDHVDDGIGGSDLVELHVGGGHTVNGALHLGQQREHRTGAITNAFGEIGRREHRVDVTPRPVMLVMIIVVMMHRHDRASGGDTAPLCALERERVVVDGQSRQDGTDDQLIGTGIDERGQGHVTGGARRTVEPSHPRHELQPRTMRATAQAAPYPLSMPTTVMPFAQVACMASKAVTPSSPDP